jgi:hypothetical protein
MNEASMHHRDGDQPPVRIVREIPLWGLILAAVSLIGQAVLMWVGQEKQAEAIVRMSLQLGEQSRQINELSVQIGSKNLKDVEHDLKLADVERRLNLMESRN